MLSTLACRDGMVKIELNLLSIYVCLVGAKCQERGPT